MMIQLKDSHQAELTKYLKFFIQKKDFIVKDVQDALDDFKVDNL